MVLDLQKKQGFCFDFLNWIVEYKMQRNMKDIFGAGNQYE
jgi:hypothetical protein